MPAIIWYLGSVKVYSGSSTANFGNTFSPNTCPTFIFSFALVMTAPPFISLPVPTIVSTQPTGMISQSGSSKRT